MTTPPAVATVATVPNAAPSDHRGSPIPTGAMITTRFMELRKRRGLMIALIVVNIGLPTVFLVIRLLAHAIAPKSYGPAGGYDIFTNLVAGVMYVFGFIVAATLGCAAGSVDLTEGMFRHLVVTGRSRLALYLARIPAGLAIVVPLVAIGFTIVCTVCVTAAPAKLNFDGVNVPAGLSRAGLANWAEGHPDEVICNFDTRLGPSTPNASEINSVFSNVRCGNGVQFGPPPVSGGAKPTEAEIRAVAAQIARMDYADYASQFLSPSDSLMIYSGLWIELEAVIGFTVGLGLASLMGQRTVPVVLLIVLELILTPILSTNVIPHVINLQRGVVGLAMAHLEPGGLPLAFGGNSRGGISQLVPESTAVVACVIAAWLVGWTVLGAWRMMTRDA